MKRIIALLLVLVMMLGTFAGCKKQEAPAPTEPTVEVVEDVVDENLDKALEYLRVFYKDTPEKTPMDYTRLGTVRVADSVYEVVWTVAFEDETVDPSILKIVVNEDGTVTIDLDEDFIYNSVESIPYVLTATLTGTDGRVVSLSWNHIIPPGIDEEALAIVDAAYALKEGAALDGTYTLTGTIISIDTMYSEQYGNITVSMVVRGREDFPIKCYRLKGTGVENLAVGDIITVTGTLKNYYGTIEFDAGCILENVVSGGGTPPTAPEDPLEILKEAYKLKKGQSLPYEVTLTGKISEIAYTWNEKYPNPTFTIVVQGQTSKPIYCYMVEGKESWLKKIEVTDTVTLTGVITNYQGTIEFNRPTMTYWKRGPGLTQTVNYGSLEEGVAYKMYMDQKTLGKTYYFNGTFSSYLGTTTNAAKATDVFMEKVKGKGVRFYYMDGEAKTYIEIYLNDEGKPRPKVTTNPSIVYNYSKDAKTYCVMLDSQEYYLGTYSTYSTIAASSTFWITGDNAGNRNKTQFLAKFIKSSEVDTESGEDEVEPGVLTGAAMTSVPVAGDVVVIANGTHGMTSLSDGTKLGAETVTVAEGVLTGTSNLAQLTVSIDGNGYYTFTTADGKYLTSGATGNSLTLESSSSNYSLWNVVDAGNGSYYIKSVNAKYNGNVQSVEYYGGFTTYGHKDTEIYQMQFYTVTSVTGGGNEIVETPVAGTAYYMMVDQKNLDKTLFFNGQTESASVTYRLATTDDGAEAVPVYLEETTGGYYLYFMNGDVKTYIRVFHRTDGDPGFGKGSLEYVTTAPAEVFTYDETYDTLIYDYDGNNAYYMGTYSTYETISVSNTSYLTTATVDDSQFPIRFSLTANSGVPGGEEPGTGDEPTTGDAITATMLTSAPAAGDVVIMANGTNGMTSAATADNKGNSIMANETVTVAEGVLTGTTALAQYTVAIDGDGYYTFTADGKYLTSGETGSALTLEATATDYSKWILEDAGNGNYRLKNYKAVYTSSSGDKPQYLEYYYGFTTYSYQDTKDSIYLINFYGNIEVVDGGDGTGTGGGNTGSGDYVLVTDLSQLSDGAQVVIAAADVDYALGTNQKTNNREAIAVTKSGNSITIGDTVQVLTLEAGTVDGTYAFSTGSGYLYAASSENNWLRTQETNDANGSWLITIDGGVTSIVAQGTNTRATMQYNPNNGTPLFSCYSSASQQPIALYVLGGESGGNGGNGGNGGGNGGNDGGNTTVNYGPLSVDTAYNMYLEQVINNKDLYFAGADNGSGFLTTTETAADATEVKMEKVEGEGVRFYFMNGSAKTYIEIYLNSDSKPRFELTTAPDAVFNYSEEAGTYVQTIGENSYYMGTYGTFDTLSASNISYITGDNAANVGVTQFLVQFVVPSGESGGNGGNDGGNDGGNGGNNGNTTYDIYGPAEENVAYALAMTTAENADVYFNGTVSSSNANTSTDAADAVEMYVEKVEDEGVRFYFMNGETKTYLEMYLYNGTKVRPILNTEPTVVFAWDNEVATYVTTVNEGKYFFGNASGGDQIKATDVEDVSNECGIAELVVPEGEKTAAQILTEQLAAANKLGDGEYLTEKTTIEGVVSVINTPYSSQYANITFTVTVDNTDGITVYCYRVKGEGMDTLVAGDKVKVEGNLTAHSGSAQFDSTATVTITEKSSNEKPTAPSDPKLIVDAAFALETGNALLYECTLTGVITEIVSPYDSSYGNITVNISVEGSDGAKVIQCYRMKGTGADTLAVGDTITVTGTIKNYNGTVEFDTGCQLVAVPAAAKSKSAPATKTPVDETPAEETPVEETPVEETPVEETPVEETPTEEPAAE